MTHFHWPLPEQRRCGAAILPGVRREVELGVRLKVELGGERNSAAVQGASPSSPMTSRPNRSVKNRFLFLRLRPKAVIFTRFSSSPSTRIVKTSSPSPRRNKLESGLHGRYQVNVKHKLWNTVIQQCSQSEGGRRRRCTPIERFHLRFC